jgi:uncharacterized protein (TIGR03435 family)
MKKSPLYLLLLLFGWTKAYTQGPKTGDKLPDFTLNHIVNSKEAEFKPEKAKGKLLIIEFWGTWCGPCIPALSHLDSLYKHFPNELVVIAVSDDSPERLEKFLVKHPVSIPLASDLEHMTNKLFKYRTVPHTILVDQNQHIVAITTPDQISDITINSLLKGQSVTLEAKQDAEFDPQKDYFSAPVSAQFLVSTKPYMQGFPSFSKPGRNAFQDRRVTFINVLPEVIFQYAYNKSSALIKNELSKESNEYKPENVICFDLIVPEDQKADLRKIMRRELDKLFAIQTQLASKDVPVYVLTKSGSYLKASQQKQLYSSSGSGINAVGVPIETLRNYIENSLNRPTINETGMTDRYDFNLEIRQEDLKLTMLQSLEKIGLSLQESQRSVEFLILKPR